MVTIGMGCFADAAGAGFVLPLMSMLPMSVPSIFIPGMLDISMPAIAGFGSSALSFVAEV